MSIIAFLVGIITAWLSVGVGELVAVYLILRGFNVTSAIASAVILSAFTVWSAVIYHLMVSQAIYWNVLLFAGAGAIVGGIVAKRVVLYFSVVKLKIFFATWILIMGIAGLITEGKQSFLKKVVLFSYGAITFAFILREGSLISSQAIFSGLALS